MIDRVLRVLAVVACRAPSRVTPRRHPEFPFQHETLLHEGHEFGVPLDVAQRAPKLFHRYAFENRLGADFLDLTRRVVTDTRPHRDAILGLGHKRKRRAALFGRIQTKRMIGFVCSGPDRSIRDFVPPPPSRTHSASVGTPHSGVELHRRNTRRRRRTLVHGHRGRHRAP